MRQKIKWRTLKFIPDGGDESQAICFRDEGFMSLCERLREGQSIGDYKIRDTKGILGTARSIEYDWSGFKEALQKAIEKTPLPKPSAFRGRWQQTIEAQAVRKRLLEAALREYDAPYTLALDLLGWLSSGRPEDTRDFLMTLLRAAGWVKESGTSQSVAPKPSSSKSDGPSSASSQPTQGQGD
jgi:hypothetical protein